MVKSGIESATLEFHDEREREREREREKESNLPLSSFMT